MSPVIGITTYNGSQRLAGMNVPAAYLPSAYSDFVIAAGGRPVLLPSSGGDEDDAVEAVGSVDGILLPGGTDLNPALYGQEPHEETARPDDERDFWETHITRNALVQGIPLLGICRGMQMLNVTLGGSLHQHIPDLYGDDVDEEDMVEHDYDGSGFGRHQVAVAAPSLLAAIMGVQDEPVDVPTRHHQAVAQIGAKLRAVAFAADGVVEAVELEADDQFAIGVQWHPERGSDMSLFTGLVKVAASRA